MLFTLTLYLSGMAQARLLDRLNPGWKAKAMQEKVYLEDLLRAILRLTSSLWF
jgi:hypothetical protein